MPAAMNTAVFKLTCSHSPLTSSVCPNFSATLKGRKAGTGEPLIVARIYWDSYLSEVTLTLYTIGCSTISVTPKPTLN